MTNDAPLDLARIDELAENASRGPWVADHVEPSVWGLETIVIGNYTTRDGVPVSAPSTAADREFIASARTDVPALVAEVRSQAERISTAERILLGGIGQSWSRVVDQALLALRGTSQ